MEDKIGQMLVNLSEKLGVTIDHLWEVLVKQSYLIGINKLFSASIILVITFMIGRYFLPRWKREEDSEKRDLFFVIGLLFFGGASTSIFYFIYNAVTCFYNPEYAAVQQLLENINN